MLQIFISYRRDDSAEITEDTYQRLIKTFGEENVFKDDADNALPVGRPFPEEIEKRVHACNVLLAIIGPKWAIIEGEPGHRRLDSEDDFVRREIELGLKLPHVTIIPVLVGGAHMPSKNDLPRSLEQLIYLEATHIRDKNSFKKDLEKLVDLLKTHAEDDMIAKIQNQLSDLSNKVVNQVEAQFTSYADTIASKVQDRLLASPLVNQGIRLVADERRGYEGFYTWVISSVKKQDLFFAGRSVLHRIDADIKDHGFESVERIIINKLKKQGIRMDVLFLDPTSNLIKRLAESEGQKYEQMLSDITVSIGVCKRFSDLFEAEQGGFPSSSQLRIRLYDDIPYFSYHKENDKVIVGFYFSTRKGYQSAAFEALDNDIKEFFEGHFDNIFDDAKGKELVKVSGNNISFKDSLYDELAVFLESKLGSELANRRLSGDISR